MSTSLKTAKRKAWAAFSRYIRLRDCLETTGTTTHGKCCTCGALKEFGELEAGHFIGGRLGHVLYDETGVHAQCTKCNWHLKGNPVAYYAFMLTRYGKAAVEEKYRLANIPLKRTVMDHRAIESHYKAKAKELEEHNENT